MLKTVWCSQFLGKNHLWAKVFAGTKSSICMADEGHLPQKHRKVLNCDIASQKSWPMWANHMRMKDLLLRSTFIKNSRTRRKFQFLHQLQVGWWTILQVTYKTGFLTPPREHEFLTWVGRSHLWVKSQSHHSQNTKHLLSRRIGWFTFLQVLPRKAGWLTFLPVLPRKAG